MKRNIFGVTQLITGPVTIHEPDVDLATSYCTRRTRAHCRSLASLARHKRGHVYRDSKNPVCNLPVRLLYEDRLGQYSKKKKILIPKPKRFFRFPISTTNSAECVPPVFSCILFSPPQLLGTPTCRRPSRCVQPYIRPRTPRLTSAHSHESRKRPLDGYTSSGE